MQTLDTWFINIYIDLKWKQIDTKMSLANLNFLKQWVEKKWK
jgi:hypothetical protein